MKAGQFVAFTLDAASDPLHAWVSHVILTEIQLYSLRTFVCWVSTKTSEGV